MKRRVLAIGLALMLLLSLCQAEEPAFERTIALDEGWFYGRIDDEWRLYTPEGVLFVDYFWANDELKESGKLPFTGFGEEKAAPIRFGRGDMALMAAIDREGAIVVPGFKGQLEAFQEGIALYRSQGDGWGLVRDDGTVLLDAAESGCEELALVEPGYWRGSAEDGSLKWFYLDEGQLLEAGVVAYGQPGIDTGSLEPLELTGDRPDICCTEQFSALGRALLALSGARVHSNGDVDGVTVCDSDTAYERLIAGKCDMILVPGPLQERAGQAEDAEIAFAQVALGRDALAFLTREDDGLEDVTTEELRQLFTEGGEDLLVYHQKKGTSAREILEALVGDADVALTESALVSEGAYCNFPGALGYAYLSQLEEVPEGVRLLRVDGFDPAEEGYPLAQTLYAVYRTDEKGWSADEVCRWLGGDAGRALLEAAGLTPASQPGAAETPQPDDRTQGDPDEVYEPVDHEALNALARVWSSKPVRFEGTVIQVMRQGDAEYIALNMGATAQMRVVMLENRTWQAVEAEGARVKVYGITLGTAAWQGVTCPLVGAEKIVPIEDP